VYVAEQARALRDAGAEGTLLCYGRGEGRDPPDLPVRRTPRALSPLRTAAGPAWAKPPADAALFAALVRLAHRERFDAVLAHNAEAAWVARLARPLARLPVVYVVHTLLGVELSAYAPRRLARTANALGRVLDAGAARGADAVLCLSERAAEVLRPRARGPVEVIPPGLDPWPDPDPEAVRRACERHGLAPGGYALYAGNLDRYQDLDLLARAAQGAPLPVAVATHAEPPTQPVPGLRLAHVAGPAEVRALTYGAALCLLPRRRIGGFPVKLLNYMEARRAIVAHASVAEGLAHDRSAWLLPDDTAPEAWAEAIRTLAGDPARAARLGAKARWILETRHAWPELAERTLDLARRARVGGRDR